MSNKNKNRPITCSQCGASEIQQAGEGTVRCAYCGSMYTYVAKGPTVVIKKGANVVFGKNAKVQIRGGLEIEDGANVRIEGELTLVQRAPQDVIDAAKLRLKKGE